MKNRNKEIANILKTKRAELKMSASEVCEELKRYGIELSPQTLYGYENGHRVPNAGIFMELCSIYHLDIEPTKDFLNVLTSFDSDRIVKMYSELNELGQHLVFQYVSFIHSDPEYTTPDEERTTSEQQENKE